ncbi:MAG TPA: hypothetical protein VGV64_08405 [Thermoplasmata archaeon]|nr:hypothetical protein [Thermoplasmata archaeon]
MVSRRVWSPIPPSSGLVPWLPVVLVVLLAIPSGTAAPASHVFAPAGPRTAPSGGAISGSVGVPSTIPSFGPPIVPSGTSRVPSSALPSFLVSSTIDLVNNTVSPGLQSPRYPSVPSGLAYDSTNHFLYVAGSGTSTVEAIDPVSGAKYAVGGPLVTSNDTAPNPAPGSVAFNPVTSQLFVTEPNFDAVAVYNVSAVSDVFSSVSTIYLGLGTNPHGVYADAADDRIFVANEGSNNISVINGANDRLVGFINVTGGPVALAYDPIQNLVFTADAFTADMNWFDPTTLTGGGGGFPVRNAPYAIAYDPANGTLWVANQRFITIVNATSLAQSVNVTLPVGTVIGGLVWDAPDQVMLVANAPSGSVSMYVSQGQKVGAIATGGTPSLGVHVDALGEVDFLDGSDNSVVRVSDLSQVVIGRANLGSTPTNAAFNPVSDRLEIADNASNRLLEMNVRTAGPGGHPVTRSLPVSGHPAAVAFDPLSGQLAVASNPGLAVGLDAASGRVRETVSLGATNQLWAITYAGGAIYVAGGPPSGSFDYLWTLDPSNLVVTSTITLTRPAGPRAFAFDPSNGNLYVALSGKDAVGVLNTRTGLYTGSFASGGMSPSGIAFEPSHGNLFVSNALSNTVTVLNATTGTLIATVPVGFLPSAVLLIPSSQLAFVPCQRSDEVDVLNTNSFGVIGTVPVGDYPGSVVYANVTGNVFVSDAPDGSLAVLPGGSPGPAPFHATLSATLPKTDIGVPTTFTVTATYPPTDFNYTYPALPSGCTSQNASTLPCRPGAVLTNFTVTVSVSNLAGDVVNASLVLNVVPVPTLASFNATPATLTLGATSTLTVLPVGGIPPYHYLYTQLPNGCAPADLAALSCRPTALGQLTASVTVVDAVQAAALGSLHLVVNNLPTITATVSPNETIVGRSVTFLVTVSLGTSPYTLTYVGLPPGCTSANETQLACAPSASGSYPVKIIATDSSGIAARVQLTLLVDPTPTAASGGISTGLVLALAAVLAVVAALAAVLWLRRRRTLGSVASEEDVRSTPAEDVYDPSTYRRLPGEEPSAPAPTQGPPIGGAEPEEPSEPAQRFFTPSEDDTPGPAGPAAAPSRSGPARAGLTCRSCGTVNEPWLTNCRKCKRPLQFT